MTRLRKILLLFFSLQRRATIVLVIMAATITLSGRSAKEYGDNLQFALPLAAWACEVTDKRGVAYFARFLIMETILQGSKHGLGDMAINRRPDGGLQGMPSGHTTAATFGASALVSSCLKRHPVAQTVVVIAAGFVGASRIESRRHNIWQVLMGVLLGWGCERFLRDDSRTRRWLLARLRKRRPANHA